VHRFSTNWEHDTDADELSTLLATHPRIRAVTVAYGDTSTGVANDIAGIARASQAHGALVLVDAVSSLGGMPFAFDEWEVDVAVTASQKCLMSSPGLAWVAMSERAWKATATSRLPKNYWRFTDIRDAVSKPKPETPGTTPVHLVLQNAEALRMIHEEGLEQVYSRHQAMAERTRQRVTTLGLTLQCPAHLRRSSTLTAIALPPGMTPRPFRESLKAAGILTAAGLGPYERTGFRIGHMGDIRLADVDRTLDAVRDALSAAHTGIAS
jgi:aspartate aminotransferase-like enzyme